MQEFTGTGRLCDSPRITRKNDKAAANFTLAVARDYRKQNEPDSDFFPCVAFGSRAEFAAKNLFKGMKIEFKGEIHTGFYEKDGHKIPTVKITLTYINFAESKAANQKYASAPENAETQKPDKDGFINMNADENSEFEDDMNFPGLDGLVSCPECGLEIPDTFTACPECGTRIP